MIEGPAALISLEFKPSVLADVEDLKSRTSKALSSRVVSLNSNMGGLGASLLGLILFTGIFDAKLSPMLPKKLLICWAFS